MNTYQIGDIVRLTGTFRDVNDVLVDPSGVRFMYIKPNTPTAITTKTYLTDIEVVKDSVGIYHLDITITESRRWFYRTEGFGANNAGAAENEFEVEDSRFYP